MISFAICAAFFGSSDSKLTEISLETLKGTPLAKGRHDRLTVLATGDLKKAYTVKAHRVSASAQEKITKAGGKVELIPIPGPQKREKKAKSSKA